MENCTKCGAADKRAREEDGVRLAMNRGARVEEFVRPYRSGRSIGTLGTSPAAWDRPEIARVLGPLFAIHQMSE
jgi:hypothetical protein